MVGPWAHRIMCSTQAGVALRLGPDSALLNFSVARLAPQPPGSRASHVHTGIASEVGLKPHLNAALEAHLSDIPPDPRHKVGGL